MSTKLKGMTPNKLKGMIPAELKGMTPDKLKGMIPAELKGMTPDKLKGMMSEKLKGMAPDNNPLMMKSPNPPVAAPQPPRDTGADYFRWDSNNIGVGTLNIISVFFLSILIEKAVSSDSRLARVFGGTGTGRFKAFVVSISALLGNIITIGLLIFLSKEVRVFHHLGPRYHFIYCVLGTLPYIVLTLVGYYQGKKTVAYDLVTGTSSSTRGGAGAGGGPPGSQNTAANRGAGGKWVRGAGGKWVRGAGGKWVRGAGIFVMAPRARRTLVVGAPQGGPPLAPPVKNVGKMEDIKAVNQMINRSDIALLERLRKERRDASVRIPLVRGRNKKILVQHRAEVKRKIEAALR